MFEKRVQIILEMGSRGIGYGCTALNDLGKGPKQKPKQLTRIQNLAGSRQAVQAKKKRQVHLQWQST